MTRSIRSVMLGAVAALLLVACAPSESLVVPVGDHSVYAAILRGLCLEPAGGPPGGLGCRGQPVRRLAIVTHTRPFPDNLGTDSVLLRQLPDSIAPLLATLRSLNELPRRSITPDSLGMPVPVRPLPDSLDGRRTAEVEERARGLAEGTPGYMWFSRVAYNGDSTRALVYAVNACIEDHCGYGLLAPLEQRANGWTVQQPVMLLVR